MSEQRLLVGGVWLAAWSPGFAPNAVGKWNPISVEAGEPTWIFLSCTRCGDEHRAACTSGNLRAKITAYAMDHVHADPLGATQLRRTTKKSTDT